jgi:hypothetical protein
MRTDMADQETSHPKEIIKERSLVEKKTVMNLLLGFAVGVKARTLSECTSSTLTSLLCTALPQRRGRYQLRGSLPLRQLSPSIPTPPQPRPLPNPRIARRALCRRQQRRRQTRGRCPALAADDTPTPAPSHTHQHGRHPRAQPHLTRGGRSPRTRTRAALALAAGHGPLCALCAHVRPPRGQGPRAPGRACASAHARPPEHRRRRRHRGV